MYTADRAHRATTGFVRTENLTADPLYRRRPVDIDFTCIYIHSCSGQAILPSDQQIDAKDKMGKGS